MTMTMTTIKINDNNDNNNNNNNNNKLLPPNTRQPTTNDKSPTTVDGNI